MFLGIEIGGTKLQVGVGTGTSDELAALERLETDARHGAVGILHQIESMTGRLLSRFDVRRIGIGFGGPVDASVRTAIKSHQVHGWDNFPLGDWCERTFNLPVSIGNDCDVAALAEARLGAGVGQRSVFYVTVGTGVGGGLVVDGKLHGTDRPAVAEIGHLRPGLNFDREDDTVESLASGWGIAETAKARITEPISWHVDSVRRANEPVNNALVKQRLEDAKLADRQYADDLLSRCDENLDRLTARLIARAAEEGNEIAREVIEHACEVLGWGISQVVTLIAPNVVVIGGGVSLIGEPLFFAPIRKQVSRFVFPPLRKSFEIVPAALGELVVVHGAILLAAESGA